MSNPELSYVENRLQNAQEIGAWDFIKWCGIREGGRNTKRFLIIHGGWGDGKTEIMSSTWMRMTAEILIEKREIRSESDVIIIDIESLPYFVAMTRPKAEVDVPFLNVQRAALSKFDAGGGCITIDEQILIEDARPGTFTNLEKTLGFYSALVRVESL